MTNFLLILILVTQFLLLVQRVRDPALAYNMHDNSDPPNGWSGLVILTDNLSGYQYLSTVFGGVTPRLDGTGKHIQVGK